MTPALAFLLVAAAAPAPSAPPAKAPAVVIRHAEAGPERAALPLATADDVARLCRALEPAERVRPGGDAVERGEAEARHASDRHAAVSARYRATVPAAGLAFAPYDAPEGRLSLAEPAQIPLAGTTRLWPTEERGLAVAADVAAARRILAAQRAGTLALDLVFDLSDDATCGSGARGKSFTVPVEPVSWRWVDGAVLLAGGGVAAERPLATAADGARPRVEVGEPLAGPRDARKAVAARVADLEACYAEALKRDPGIDGVLVVDLGGPRATVAVDSVADEPLVVCVARALAPLAPAPGGKVSVPIRFELAAPTAAAAPTR